MNDDIWNWLISCRRCGRAHKPVETKGLAPQWADPDDGHPYAARLRPALVAALRAAYEADRRAHTE